MANEYKRKLQAIQTILDEYGVESDELTEALRDAEQYPSGEVVNEYNKLVEEYQSATGTVNALQAGEELLAYYRTHQEELSDPTRDRTFADLEKTIEDTYTLRRLVDEAQAAWEES